MSCPHHWTVTSECPQCLRGEVEALREALKFYGRHSDDCDDGNAYNGERHGPCGCGLDAALAGEKP